MLLKALGVLAAIVFTQSTDQKNLADSMQAQGGSSGIVKLPNHYV